MKHFILFLFIVAGLVAAPTTPINNPVFSGVVLSISSQNAINVAAGVTPATELEVDSTATTSPRGIMSAQYSTGTDGARFHMRKARGTRAAPTTVVTGDNLGRLVASGYDGTNFLEMASIIFGTEGTIGTGRVPTMLTFQTATDAATSVLTTAFTVNSNQSIRIPSTNTAGLQLYNTLDQTTNYERLEMLWSGNVAYLSFAKAGTGVSRTLGLCRNTNTSTSGTFAAVSITPTYNQSASTAANTDLLINRTETAVGSGSQNLIQAQAGSVDKFVVNNGGSVGSAGQIRVGGVTFVNSRFSVATAAAGYSAWTTNGVQARFEGGTFTDTSTAGSSTATSAVFTSFAQPILAATNSSVTTTDAATVYIANAPANGTNNAIANPYALWVAAGRARFDGGIVGTAYVVARTAKGTAAVRDSYSVTTNEGATSKVDRTLPTAVAGLQYTYVVQDTDGIRVIASAGDTIRIAETVTAAAGYIENATIGSTVTLVAINATEWIAVASNGTWTFGP